MTDPRDVAAWELAISMMRLSGEPVWTQNVDRLVKEIGLEKTGQWASRMMQFRTLKSKPWLAVPAHLDDADVDRTLAIGDGRDDHGWYVAAVMRKRMRRHGISRWHPDPMRAIAEAERKR